MAHSCCCVGGLGDKLWLGLLPSVSILLGGYHYEFPISKKHFQVCPFLHVKGKRDLSALFLGILVEQFVPSGPHLMLYSPKTHSWTDLTHWHYTTMYLFFLLSGIVDVVSHSPLKLPLGLDRLSLSVALFMEGEWGAGGRAGVSPACINQKPPGCILVWCAPCAQGFGVLLMSSLLSPASQKCTDSSNTKGQTLTQSSVMLYELQVPISGLLPGWDTGMPVALAVPLSYGLVVPKAGSCTVPAEQGDSSWLFASSPFPSGRS